MNSVLVPLVKHRWLGNAYLEHWRCSPASRSLRRSFDPECFGCESVIRWADVPHLDRFRVGDVSELGFLLVMESLALRLDLAYCELQLEERRRVAS